MHRRDFFKKTGLTALAAGLPFVKMEAEKSVSAADFHPKLLKPARLRDGATIGLIAPASPPSEEKFAKAFANIEALGFRMKSGAHMRDQNGHLAGTDAARLADLHQAFADPEVDAVWCVRGGYGCSRLLPDVDYDLIRRHPKPFIGYSDVTALHLAISQRTGLVTFHGPVAAADFPDNTLAHFRQVLIEPTPRYTIAAPKAGEASDSAEYQSFAITPGLAEGRLTGGNLALLSALAGTPFAPEFRDKIVFIEDVGEQPYRIDRMLTQLLQATNLPKAAGIVLGVFFDCAPKPGSPSLTLEATLRDRLGPLGIPVFYGLPFGHVSHQATFPYGIRAELDANQRQLTLLETGVE